MSSGAAAALPALQRAIEAPIGVRDGRRFYGLRTLTRMRRAESAAKGVA